MEFIAQHPWRGIILTRLTPEEKERQPIADLNPDWLYIDSEVMKYSTLSHQDINSKEIQERALKLLATESKDLRILASLVMSLQRSSVPEQILLAITLLTDYLELFWHNGNQAHRRISTILQRFEQVKGQFVANAIEEEREESTLQFVRLKQFWQKNHPDYCAVVDKLLVSYAKPSAIANEIPKAKTTDNPKNDGDTKRDNVKGADVNADRSVSEAQVKPIPEVTLDQSSDRAWRNTLLKIAEIESARTIANPISFQLRRHVAWSMLDGVPAADGQGHTTVPPLALEKMAEYEREISIPSLALWKKIENTLSYSPYWLDGHAMSALIADKLGYSIIAEVIRNELTYFLERFPNCKKLKFSDGRPFMNEQTQKWIERKNSSSTLAENQNYEQALTIFNQQGLQPAMQHLEQSTSKEPRARFHAQALVVQLLSVAGCHNLAQQQLDNLRAKAMQLTASEWEPSFFERCHELSEKIGNKELL